jgi:dihydrodipicolinate synthase/N-acetylneuraminate lyase
MSPETLEALASRHPNFYLFKDTSGADRAAKAGFRDAFLVRGAEGDYARQLTEGGGIYDGFLLSTANCFGKQLAQLIGGFSESSKTEAETFSRALSALWDALFPLAGQVGYGNAFTNINKAIDHIMAHGPEAGDVAPPLLHSGKRLPHHLISAAGEELQRYGLMPEKGYLRG